MSTEWVKPWPSLTTFQIDILRAVSDRGPWPNGAGDMAGLTPYAEGALQVLRVCKLVVKSEEGWKPTELGQRVATVAEGLSYLGGYPVRM